MVYVILTVGRMNKMKQIIYNYDYLTDEDINKTVCRAKALLINSNDEILMCYCDKNYQLPGGHLEDGETLDECIVRELKEETGIDLPLEKRKPFFVITYLIKDYPNKGDNSKYIANYYSIKSDLKINLSQTCLTSSEKEGRFKIKYIHKDKIIEEIENSLDKCTRKVVVLDTLEAIKEYLAKEN